MFFFIINNRQIYVRIGDLVTKLNLRKKNSVVPVKMPGRFDIDLKYENSTDDEYLL